MTTYKLGEKLSPMNRALFFFEYACCTKFRQQQCSIIWSHAGDFLFFGAKLFVTIRRANFVFDLPQIDQENGNAWVECCTFDSSLVIGWFRTLERIPKVIFSLIKCWILRLRDFFPSRCRKTPSCSRRCLPQSDCKLADVFPLCCANLTWFVASALRP